MQLSSVEQDDKPNLQFYLGNKCSEPDGRPTVTNTTPKRALLIVVYKKQRFESRIRKKKERTKSVSISQHLNNL